MARSKFHHHVYDLDNTPQTEVTIYDGCRINGSGVHMLGGAHMLRFILLNDMTMIINHNQVVDSLHDLTFRRLGNVVHHWDDAPFPMHVRASVGSNGVSGLVCYADSTDDVLEALHTICETDMYWSQG